MELFQMKKALLIFLAAFSPITVGAQEIRVVASVSDVTIGTQESLVYTIDIRGANTADIMTPSAPDAIGLTLMQSVPGTNTNVSIVNGVVEQSFGFRWSYRPIQEGSARIGSATVRIGDKSYRTKPIAITVVPQSQRPTRRAPSTNDPFSSLFSSPFDQNNEPEPAEPGDQDIFIRVIPSARTAVQNQQVTLEYQLFFREGIQLRQSRLTDSWDAEGFWREEMDVETRPIPQIVVENGLRYNKIILKRAALFPTRPGTLRIDPLKIESEALLPSPSRDPFRQLFSMRTRFRPVKLASSGVVIESRPLPHPAPASFGGAVGQYHMTTRLDRKELKVGESLQLTIAISGTGNLATMESPEFHPPAAFEQYDPEVTSTLNRQGRKLSGNKLFTYVMVPRSNGSFEIPAIYFTFFNPDTEKYVTEHSAMVPITVTGTATTPVSIATTTNGLPVDDVAPAFDEAGTWIYLHAPALHRRAWPYLVLLVPLLLLGGVMIFQKRRDRLAGDLVFARNRRAHPLARKYLKEARGLMEYAEAAAFFEAIEHSVLGFIGNRLNIMELGMTRRQLQESLVRASVPEVLRRRLDNLLDRCDRGRFSPTGVGRDERDETYAEAAALIVLLDREIGESS